MKKNYLLIFGILLSFATEAQNLSYTCPRDTILGCSDSCIVIKAQIPDLHSLTSDYWVTNVSPIFGCRPYVDPGGAGPSANIIDDDIYSSVINIGFNFVFYGKTFNQVIISPNGVISFDISKAGGTAHYASGTGTTPYDIPTTNYDRSIIMGVYHDMDIREAISPNRKIKYNMIGTAPNRKWIMSCYKMPLFYNGNGCNVFFENTHQIIIHESSGIAEVQVISRQPCTAWQEGRGVIGIQDSSKTRGIMAPGRKASSPLWGTVNMNETWRFIPKGGASLYQSVELVDASGNVVAVGDTVRVNENTFSVTFPSICNNVPGNHVYAVKTTYKRIDNPALTFYSLDTINVLKQATLPLTASMTPTTCGNTSGTITVNVAGGTGPYQYTLNNGTAQTSNTFNNLAAGSFNISVTDALGCNNSTSINVTSLSSLAGTVSGITATGCPGVNNGTATVTPSAGAAPFTFVLDGTTTQSSGIFTTLSAGTHTVVFTDAFGCTGSVTFSIAAGNSLTATAATTATSCSGVNDGTITITMNSGTAPYQYQLTSTSAFQTSNVFTGVPAASYIINLRDAVGCTGTRTVTVSAGAGLTGTATFTPTSCSGVNNGTITVTMTNGNAPYTYTLDGGLTQSSNVFTGVSAGTHVILIKDVNNCSVQKLVAVSSGTGLTASITFTAASCPGINNGTITVNNNNGTSPFSYKLDGGTPQSSNVFTGVAAGTHTISYTDANGCTGTGLINVTSSAPITGTATSTPTFCPVSLDGTVTVNANTGSSPFTYAIDGGAYQTSNIFSGLAAGNHTAYFKDNNGCIGTAIVTVNPGPALTATVTATPTSCPTAANGTVTLTAPTGTGPFTYSLNGGAPVNGPLFTGLAAGTYNISFTDIAGCQGTASGIVTQGQPITGTASSTPTSCISALNGTITAAAQSGTAPFSYTLDAGPSQSNPVFNGVSSGIHNILITDNAGCTVTAAVTVGFGPDLTGSATSTSTSCPGVNDGTVLVSVNSGSAPYSFNIDGGSFQNSNIFNGVAAGSHNIAFFDAFGCPGATSVLVNQGSSLSSNLVISNPACANINDGSITINPTSGAGPYEYAINGGSFQTSNIFNNLPAGSYSILIRNQAGCTGTNQALLATNNALGISLTSTMPLCNGNSNGSINCIASGGVAPYQYSVNNSPNQSSPVLTNQSAGVKNIRLTDAAGCTLDTSLVLSEPSVLSATAISTSSTCAGGDGTITVTATGGTANYDYSINNGGTYQAANVFVVGDGTYNNILVKDQNNCIANTSVIVDRIDNMTLSLEPTDTTICITSSITLFPSTNAGNATFRWTSNNAPLSTINNANIQNAVITPLDTSKYYVSAQWGVCSRIDSIVINVLHKPIPYAGEDTAICFDQRVAYLHGSAISPSGDVSFSWSPADSLVSPNDTNTVALVDATTTYTLTVSDLYGCNFQVTDQVQVIKQPPVPAFAGNDTIAPRNQPIQLYASGGANYLWSPANALNSPYINNPTATISNDTRFILVVSDAYGCIGYDTLFVKVYDGPAYYIPKAFSPNNDGLNDVFRPIPVGMTKTEYFRVYNRSGQLVFETREWMKGWDGKTSGRIQPIGTYVWTVKGWTKDGKLIEAKGNVLLIR